MADWDFGLVGAGAGGVPLFATSVAGLPVVIYDDPAGQVTAIQVGPSDFCFHDGAITGVSVF